MKLKTFSVNALKMSDLIFINNFAYCQEWITNI